MVHTPQKLWSFGYTVEKNKMSAFCRIQIKEKFSCWSYIICQKKAKNNVLELLELEKIHLYNMDCEKFVFCLFFRLFLANLVCSTFVHSVSNPRKSLILKCFCFKSADYQNKCEFNLAKIS